MAPYLHGETHVIKFDKWKEYRLGDVFKGRHDAISVVCQQFPHSLGCMYKKSGAPSNDIKEMMRILDSRPHVRQPLPDTVIIHLRLGDGLCVQHDAKCHRLRDGVPNCWLYDEDCWIDHVSEKNILRYAYSKKWYESVVTALTPSQKIILVSDDEHWTRIMPDPRGKDRSIGRLYKDNVASYFRSHGFQVKHHIQGSPDEDFIFMCGSRVFVPSGGGFSALVASIVGERNGIIIQPRQTVNVSIIVPAIISDFGDNLERLLDSINTQIVLPTEVIIVASGVIEERCASQPRIGHRFQLRFLCRRSLLNQATARNIGMDNAKGEWFSFIDADDKMMPERISILNNYIHTNPALRLFLHGWDNNKEIGPLIYGEELYDIEKQTRGTHDWVLDTVMHSQASVHHSVGVRFRPGKDMFRKEDSIFVRDVIKRIGRVNNQMLFDPSPLGHHKPRGAHKTM